VQATIADDDDDPDHLAWMTMLALRCVFALDQLNARIEAAGYEDPRVAREVKRLARFSRRVLAIQRHMAKRMGLELAPYDEET
jgi:hypothetical protein